MLLKMSLRPAAWALLALSFAWSPQSHARETFAFQKLADGVYVSIRTDPVGLGVDANNLFIIAGEGVVAVDTNFGPSSTRQVLAALRGITDKPVTHVINLVVSPIPLVGGDQSYVAEWSSTLEQVMALDPKVIVPGHGPIMRDTSHLRLMADLFVSVTKQVKTAADAGQSLEQVRKSVNLDEFRQKFAGDSQLKKFLFANYVTGPAVTSAFRAARQQ